MIVNLFHTNITTTGHIGTLLIDWLSNSCEPLDEILPITLCDAIVVKADSLFSYLRRDTRL